MGKKKKLFVVSDIHGYYTLLKEALDKAGYDSKNQNHFLVCLGDYFDRGTENFEVLKYFERIENGVLLRGNHEDLLLKVFERGQLLPHNYINGTLKTLENFFGKYVVNPEDDTIDFSGKTGTVNRVCEFINNTVNYFETQNYVFVHGWLPEGDYKNAQNAQWDRARWVKWTNMYSGERPLENKNIVCGHMPTFFANQIDKDRSEDNADIFYGKGLIAIDAGTNDTKQVNVLVLEDELI